MPSLDDSKRRGSHGGHRRGGKPGGRHSRRRRPLGHGELKFVLLGMIAKAPSHGYDLIAGIETVTSGAYVPSPGTIYPTLDVMQDLGWVTAEDVNGKRVMHITPVGQTALTENEQLIAQTHQRLETLTSKGQSNDLGHPRGEMRRLRHTVKAAILKDEGALEAISAVLTEAREKIEKL